MSSAPRFHLLRSPVSSSGTHVYPSVVQLQPHNRFCLSHFWRSTGLHFNAWGGIRWSPTRRTRPQHISVLSSVRSVISFKNMLSEFTLNYWHCLDNATGYFRRRRYCPSAGYHVVRLNQSASIMFCYCHWSLPLTYKSSRKAFLIESQCINENSSGIVNSYVCLCPGDTSVLCD